MPGTVSIEGDDLVFELHGLDEILAIKRKIIIPLEHVASVSTDRVPWKAFRQIKAAGTAIPGIVKDGRFLDPDEGIIFFEMHDPESCITVNLDHERYRKIVFEVEDKRAATIMINAALESRRRAS